MGLDRIESDMMNSVHSPLKCPARHVSATCPKLRGLPARGKRVPRGGDGQAGDHVLADHRVPGQV